MPPFLGERVNVPVLFVAAPVTWVLSWAFSNSAVAPGRVSPVFCSVTIPVMLNFCAHVFVGHTNMINAITGRRMMCLFIGERERCVRNIYNIDTCALKRFKGGESVFRPLGVQKVCVLVCVRLTFPVVIQHFLYFLRCSSLVYAYVADVSQ